MVSGFEWYVGTYKESANPPWCLLLGLADSSLRPLLVNTQCRAHDLSLHEEMIDCYERDTHNGGVVILVSQQAGDAVQL